MAFTEGHEESKEVKEEIEGRREILKHAEI